MKLSIIIPVYNEERTVEKVVSMVQDAPVKLTKEIIIVDDYSTDRTRLILGRYHADKDIKVIFQPKNLGKGSAIRRALSEVTGDFVIVQDADLEYSVDDYPAILQPLIENKADVVYGSRFLGSISGMRWQNRLANKILTLTARLLYSIKITDEATAYKAFKKEVITGLTLRSERFEFCPEVTAKAAKKGYRFREVPITYRGRNSKEGKKIKFQDGFSAFWTLVKYRFKD